MRISPLPTASNAPPFCNRRLSPPTVIDLRGSRPEGRIHSVFVDPTGNHVIISTVLAGSGINFHVDSGEWVQKQTRGAGSGFGVQRK